jgi:hypothetical protein
MPRHRRRRTGLFVRRRTYRSLQAAYAQLLADYRALESDHQGVLEDHEGLLHDLESPVPAPVPHTPSWAVTEEIPVITTVGLDPDKADALARRGGLLADPGGAWNGQQPGTTG